MRVELSVGRIKLIRTQATRQVTVNSAAMAVGKAGRRDGRVERVSVARLLLAMHLYNSVMCVLRVVCRVTRVLGAAQSHLSRSGSLIFSCVVCAGCLVQVVIRPSSNSHSTRGATIDDDRLCCSPIAPESIILHLSHSQQASRIKSLPRDHICVCGERRDV